MKMEELFELINEMLDEEQTINANTDLVDDLSFDSLKYIDLIVMLENNYGIVIEEEKLIDIKTVQQLHDACLEIA